MYTALVYAAHAGCVDAHTVCGCVAVPTACLPVCLPLKTKPRSPPPRCTQAHRVGRLARNAARVLEGASRSPLRLAQHRRRAHALRRLERSASLAAGGQSWRDRPDRRLQHLAEERCRHACVVFGVCRRANPDAERADQVRHGAHGVVGGLRRQQALKRSSTGVGGGGGWWGYNEEQSGSHDYKHCTFNAVLAPATLRCVDRCDKIRRRAYYVLMHHNQKLTRKHTRST